ncbi:MAG: caspase family protein [Myxococcales bacterium]|nr:caspase family protein [Myxococcales bacterium]
MSIRWIHPCVALFTAIGCSGGKLPPPAADEPLPTLEARLMPQLGHTRPVVEAIFAPGGDFVVTASEDGSIGIWDGRSDNLLIRLPTLGPVHDVDLSPDGTKVVASSRDGTQAVWSPRTGERLFDLKGIEADERIHDVHFSADGKQILGTPENHRSGHVWSATDGSLLWTVPAKTESSWMHLAFAGASADVLAVDRKGAVVRFREGTPEPVARLEAHEFSMVQTSPDGTTLLTSGQSRASLWDLSTGQRTHRLQIERWARVAGFNEDSTKVFTLDPTVSGGAVDVWDVASGDRLHHLTSLEGGQFQFAAFSDDGDFLVAAANDASAAVLDLTTGERRHTLKGHDKPLLGATFSPDSARVVTVSRDGTASVHDLATGERTFHLRPRAAPVMRIGVSPGGNQLVVGSMDGSVTVWDAALGSPLFHREDHDGLVLTAEFSPDGAQIATSGPNGQALLRDATTGRVLHALRGHEKALVAAMAFSPDGATVVTGAADNQAILWDAATGEELGRFEGHRGAIRDVDFSPSGDRIVTASWDHHSRVFDVASGEILLEMVGGNNSPNNHAEFSPDGSMLATVSGDQQDSRPLLSSAADGRHLSRLETEYRGQAMMARFSPDGSRVATAGPLNEAYVLDASTGEQLLALRGHVGDVFATAYSPDGRLLFTGARDGTVRIWDAQTGASIGALMSFEGGDWAVVDSAGRYDASRPDLEGLAWIIGNAPYGLSQLRDLYYTPGLGRHLLTGGSDDTPIRAVPPLDEIQPPPDVQLTTPEPGESRAVLTVTQRGGGVGKVFVSLNGSDISDEVASTCKKLALGSPCELDLSKLPYYSDAGGNRVRAWASDVTDRVASRGLDVAIGSQTRSMAAQPHLWAIVVGIGDYTGDGLDLMFPARDAASMARALALAGQRGFGEERTHVTLLATDPDAVHPITGEPVQAPTFDRLQAAFDKLRAGAPDDTLVIYLSGHGVSQRDAESDDFFYLLPDAATMADVTDPALRAQRTISGSQLEDWLLRSPAARRVVILDTCESGAAVDRLSTRRRALSADALRAHARARERTGAWILAGAAADRAAFEASRYGQGVLTYALLEAFAGPAVINGQVMVSQLFRHAEDRVPELAHGVGGVQRPFPRRGANDFHLGELDREDQARIRPLGVRPVVVRTDLDLDGRSDKHGLSAKIDAALRDVASEPGAPLMFIDADAFPGAWTVTGDYVTSDSSGWRAQVWLEGERDGAELSKEISVASSDLDGLASQLSEAISGVIRAQQ